MKFIVGFVAGALAGAAAAVAYSVSTGRDLREEFAEFRGDLSRGDLDALGARLEARFNEMSTQIEARVSQVRAAGESAMAEADDSLDTLPDATADAAATAAEVAAEAEAKVEAAAEDEAKVEAAAEDETKA